MTEVKTGKLSDIKPTRNNSNKHTARGMKALENALSEDGYVAPMTATADGEIIDGDARLHVAFDKFGDEALIVHHDGTKPIVMVRDDIPNADHPTARRIHYRANTIAWQNLDLDPSVIMADIEAGFDFEKIDLSLMDLGELLGKAAGELLNGGNAGADTEPQIDKAEELRQKWGVEPGQLWQLGEHRLICGDCTDPAIVARVMRGEKAALCVTDPPYGVEYASKNKWLNAISRGNSIQTEIKNDHETKEETQAIWKAAFFEMGNILQPGGVVYCFMPQGGDQMMMMMMMGAGIEPRHELIWLKNNHVLGRVDYAYKHEPILYAWKEGGHKFYGDFQTSILEFPKPLKSDLHPTMKPVPLVEKLISNSSQKMDTVYDPFSGSGTTIIACENLNRRCRAIEIAPGYVAVALQRFLDHTGIQPVLLEQA